MVFRMSLIHERRQAPMGEIEPVHLGERYASWCEVFCKEKRV